MCQSAGCLAMPSASWSAIVWVSARTRTSSGPDVRRRHRQRAVHAAAGRVAARTTATRRTAARRCAGQQRRAGRHPGAAAEERHLDAAGGQVPVGQQRHDPRLAAAAPPARPAAAGSPPVSRDDLHAERLAEGDEPPVHALRLEPLGDRGDRPAVGARPRRRRRPSCRRAAARPRSRCPAATASPSRWPRSRWKPAQDLLPATASAAGTPPASTGRTSAARRGPARRSSASGTSGPTTRRRLRAQPLGARARAGGRPGRPPARNSGPGDRLGQRPDQPPAGGVARARRAARAAHDAARRRPRPARPAGARAHPLDRR